MKKKDKQYMYDIERYPCKATIWDRIGLLWDKIIIYIENLWKI